MTDVIDDVLNALYKLYTSGEDPTLADALIASCTTEQLALVAIAARNKRLEIEKQMAAMLAPLNTVYDAIQAKFLADMNATGETNKSGAGWRATMSTTYNASMPDAGAFYAWLANSGRYDMLQRRLSVKTIEDYFTETATLPPGVTLQPINKVTFYRNNR